MAVDPLLEIRDFAMSFRTDEGDLRAVDGVSWSVGEGSTLALVGESGCGKSVTALSILRLLPEPPARIDGGQILFRGNDLLTFDDASMRKVRGNEISMVFQEPMSSLNPVISVGHQIMEATILHQGLTRRAARANAIELLHRVGISSPEIRVDEYPHELSGGMQQRVMIAMALACNPSLLIADEPTTALDVTIQAQIIDLLRELQEDSNMTIVLITHDLGVVAELADRVAVMYAARIVEYASVEDLFRKPRHPYTQGLFRSLPPIDRRLERLEAIPGTVPDLASQFEGCRFRSRCPLARERCALEDPAMTELEPGHDVACHFPL